MRLPGAVFLLGLSLLTAAAFLLSTVLGVAVAGLSCLAVAWVLVRAGA